MNSYDHWKLQSNDRNNDTSKGESGEKETCPGCDEALESGIWICSPCHDYYSGNNGNIEVTDELIKEKEGR